MQLKHVEIPFKGLAEFLYPIAAIVTSILFVLAAALFLIALLKHYSESWMLFRFALGGVAVALIWKGLSVPVLHVTAYGPDMVLAVCTCLLAVLVAIGRVFDPERLRAVPRGCRFNPPLRRTTTNTRRIVL